MDDTRLEDDGITAEPYVTVTHLARAAALGVGNRRVQHRTAGEVRLRDDRAVVELKACLEEATRLQDSHDKLMTMVGGGWWWQWLKAAATQQWW